MKRTQLLELGFSFFLLFSITLLGSCRHIEPDKVQKDSIVNKSTFKSILSFGKDGKLNALPKPLLKFYSTKEDIIAWEKEYGGTLLTERLNGEDLICQYKTNDPKKLNPIRSYVITQKGKGKLKIVMVTCALHLFYNKDTQPLTLNEETKTNLENENYRAIDDEGNSFSNDKYLLFFSTLDIQGEKYATILFSLNPNSSSQKAKFHPKAKDFPLLSIPFAQLTKEKIAEYEKSTGRILAKSSTENRLIYFSKKDNDSNFQIVSYQLKSEGKQIANIVANSLSIDESMYLNDNNVEAWFKLNNIPKAQADKDGRYIAKMDNYIFEITFNPSVGTQFVFLPINNNVTPEPTNKNYDKMMPILLFGEKFDETGKIWEKETQRAVNCILEKDEENGYFMKAYPKKEYPQTAFKVSGFYYYSDNYDNKKDVVCRLAEVSFTNIKCKGDDQKIKDFLKSQGFEYTGSYQASWGQYKDRWTYENKEKGIAATIDKMGGVDKMAIAFSKSE